MCCDLASQGHIPEDDLLQSDVLAGRSEGFALFVLCRLGFRLARFALACAACMGVYIISLPTSSPDNYLVSRRKSLRGKGYKYSRTHSAMKGTEYFVSLQTSAVLTDECSVMVDSEEFTDNEENPITCLDRP